MEWCGTYRVAVGKLRCHTGQVDGVPACVLCHGTALEKMPDPVPKCVCGRPADHDGECPERRTFFDSFREPTREEAAYIEARLAGESRADAYLAAFPGRNPLSPATEGGKLERKPHIQRAITQIMDDSGITDEDIVRVMKDGLAAASTVTKKTGVDDNGQPVYENIERPDHPTRARFVELALKVKGHLSNSGESAVPHTINITNNFSLKKTDQSIRDGHVVDVTPGQPDVG